MREVLEDYIGGGWGQETPDDAHSEPGWVIRGADFPAVRRGDVSGIPHRYHKSSNMRSRRLAVGDIIFEISGGTKGRPVGRTLLVSPRLTADLSGDVICASFCKMLRPNAGLVEPTYLFWALQHLYLIGVVEQYQVQSTGISNFQFESFIDDEVLPLPPLPDQKRIASILSAYDELIQNNTLRIQVLEEMAQTVYREWFVRFRFPGHEGVPLEETRMGPAPSGWEVRPFASIGDYMNGFAFKPAQWTSEGMPIIKIRELKNGVTKDTPRWPDDGTLRKFLIVNGDLLFSWSGDLDAYVWCDGEGWLNQHLFKVTPAPDVPKLLLFHALREHMDEFRSRSQGTTMRHIKRAALAEVQTLLPPLPLRRQFNRVVEPIETLRLNLRTANHALSAARDLLLPRLISGEVDVSDLDIDTSGLVA